METKSNQIVDRLTIAIRRACLEQTFWNWFKQNAHHTTGVWPNYQNGELKAAYYAGKLLEYANRVAGSSSNLDFLSCFDSVPLYYTSSTGKGSISMNSRSHTFIHYRGQRFNEGAISYVNGAMVVQASVVREQDDGDKGKGRENEEENKKKKIVVESQGSTTTGRVVGAIVIPAEKISDEAIDAAKDVSVALAVLERTKKTSNGVSTSTVGVSMKPNNGLVDKEFGQDLLQLAPIVEMTPRSTHLSAMSNESVMKTFVKGAKGVYDQLVLSTSSTYVEKGCPVVNKLKDSQHLDVRTAYRYLNQSRTLLGSDEKGVRALSSGAAYCNLVDKHDTFRDHDTVLAINEWLTYCPQGNGDKKLVGAAVKYDSSLNWVSVLGAGSTIVNRLITNISIPPGVGLYVESNNIDFRGDGYNFIVGAVPIASSVRSLRITKGDSIRLDEVDYFTRLGEAYEERLSSYDFIGPICKTKGYVIPLRSIHRGLVIHTIRPTPYVMQDIIDAMVASNLYRNCWLIYMDETYVSFMEKKLGKANTYVSNFSDVVVFNAPYKASDSKYISVFEDVRAVQSVVPRVVEKLDMSAFIPIEHVPVQHVYQPQVMPNQSYQPPPLNQGYQPPPLNQGYQPPPYDYAQYYQGGGYCPPYQNYYPHNYGYSNSHPQYNSFPPQPNQQSNYQNFQPTQPRQSVTTNSVPQQESSSEVTFIKID